MERRYGALRFISTFYKVSGVIIALVAVIWFIGAAAVAVQFGGLAAIVIPIPVLAGGIFFAVFVIGVGEFIKLMIDIEENTRRIRHNTDRQSSDFTDPHGPWGSPPDPSEPRRFARPDPYRDAPRPNR